MQPPLSIRETADRIGLSVQGTRNLCRAGELEYLVLGNAWRVEISALEAYLERKRQEAKERAKKARLQHHHH